jgi:hypothetical protein
MRSLFSCALLLVTGCSWNTAATTGERFPGQNSAPEAARASAQKDIPCPPDRVTLVGSAGYREAAIVSAEGCGQRVTYMVFPGEEPGDRKLALIARVPLP